MNRPGDTAGILATWTANARPWTEAVRSGQLESRRVATDAAIVDALRTLGVSRVLDVGCGEGWLCRALADHGMVPIGIDGATALVDAARALGGGPFHVCSYAALADAPLAFGRFDAAVCNFALFEEDLAPLLGALQMLLAPAGTLVIQTVHPDGGTHGGNADGWRRETFGALGPTAFEPMPWFFRTADRWHRDLAVAGFTVSGQHTVHHPHSGMPLSLLLHARPRT